MPLYVFEHPKTGETVELLFGMNDTKEYRDKNGTKWKRVFLNPNASIDTKIDPNSQKDFRDKLANKNDTLGALWDRSAEMSAQRAEKNGGVDPVKQKYYEEFAKKRKGKRHPAELREAQAKAKEKANKVFKKHGLDVKI